MPKVELSKEVLAQVDKAFQKAVDDLYPPDINKTEYIEACLHFAINCEEDIKERIEEQKGKPCKECGEGTHGTCTSCGEPLCDDCAVMPGSSGSGAYLSEGTRCCPGECEEKEAGLDNL
jgi:hypothetical protein